MPPSISNIDEIATLFGSGDTGIGPVEICVELGEDSVDGFTLSHRRRENIVLLHGQRIA